MWGPLRAQCWTLPVKIIEVNVSTSWSLKILENCGHMASVLCVNCEVSSILSSNLLTHRNRTPVAGTLREAWNISFLRTCKTCMEPCQLLIFLNCLLKVFRPLVDYKVLSLPPVLRGKQPGPPPQRNDARRPIVWTRRPCEDSNCINFNFQFDSPVVEIFQTVRLILGKSSFLHLYREWFFWPGIVLWHFLWYQLHCPVHSDLQTWITGCHTCRRI